VKANMEGIRVSLQDVAGEALKDVRLNRDLALEMFMTNFAHAMQRRVDRFVHTSVEKTWTELDRNRNGSLSKSELRTVVSNILRNLQICLPGLVEEAMQPAFEDLHEWIHSDAMGPMGYHRSGGSDIALEQTTQARIQSASKKVNDMFPLLIKGLIDNAEQIADELFGVLDRNKDGKISKVEFAEGFSEAMGPVLDFARIVKLMQRERSGQKLAGDGVGDGMTLLWGLGFTAIMAGLVYQAFKMKHR